jgi:hypothetical protein
MAIGPQGPLLKNDGPACRMCGCTEHNACVELGNVPLTARIAKAVRMPATRMPRLLTCSWVKVEGNTEPLCSACSGTAADMQEALGRGCRMLQQHSNAGIDFALVIGNAARARYRARLKAQKGA